MSCDPRSQNETKKASANTNLQPGAWNNRFFAALTFLLSVEEQPQASSFSIRVTSIKQSKK